MKVVGIDPGMTGAWAVLNGEAYTVSDLPLMRDKALAWIDCDTLMSELMGWRAGDNLMTCYIERQSARPGQGVMRVFHSGMVFGSIIAACQAAACRVEFVSAGAWKRALGLSSDKRASLDKARLLFPHASLDRQKDHNRAEALLIAYYARSKQA